MSSNVNREHDVRTPELVKTDQERFTCSICGLECTERYSPLQKYCKPCQSGYSSWRQKRIRRGETVSMKAYRAWREMQGMPTQDEWKVRKGRAPLVDPDDLRRMPIREATVAFLALLKERFPECNPKLYVRADNWETNQFGLYEVGEHGWYEVDQVTNQDAREGKQ